MDESRSAFTLQRSPTRVGRARKHRNGKLREELTRKDSAVRDRDPGSGEQIPPHLTGRALWHSDRRFRPAGVRLETCGEACRGDDDFAVSESSCEGANVLRLWSGRTKRFVLTTGKQLCVLAAEA